MKYFLFAFFACLSVGQGVFAQAPAVKKYCTFNFRHCENTQRDSLKCSDPEGQKNFNRVLSVYYREMGDCQNPNKISSDIYFLFTEASKAGFELHSLTNWDRWFLIFTYY